MKKLIIIICILFSLASCDTFTGCGPIVAVYAPEEITHTKYYNGYPYTYYTGQYRYPVSVQAENGKRYKIYTSYNTWYNAHFQDIILCAD